MVIHFAFLWNHEAKQGLVEGVKHRPCLIVAVEPQLGELRVSVLPITHRQPAQPSFAVALNPATKRHLGLDDAPSWIDTSEGNTFGWPGFDIRQIPNAAPGAFVYGRIAPNTLRRVIKAVAQVVGHRAFRLTPR